MRHIYVHIHVYYVCIIVKYHICIFICGDLVVDRMKTCDIRLKDLNLRYG